MSRQCSKISNLLCRSFNTDRVKYKNVLSIEQSSKIVFIPQTTADYAAFLKFKIALTYGHTEMLVI